MTQPTLILHRKHRIRSRNAHRKLRLRQNELDSRRALLFKLATLLAASLVSTGVNSKNNPTTTLTAFSYCSSATVTTYATTFRCACDGQQRVVDCSNLNIKSLSDQHTIQTTADDGQLFLQYLPSSHVKHLLLKNNKIQYYSSGDHMDFSEFGRLEMLDLTQNRLGTVLAGTRNSINSKTAAGGSSSRPSQLKLPETLHTLR